MRSDLFGREVGAGRDHRRAVDFRLDLTQVSRDPRRAILLLGQERQIVDRQQDGRLRIDRPITAELVGRVPEVAGPLLRQTQEWSRPTHDFFLAPGVYPAVENIDLIVPEICQYPESNGSIE